MTHHVEYDSRYDLYDRGSLTEAADALIDEFIATLTIEDLDGIHNHVCDEAWALVERCVTFSVARGIDINTLGFSDTASRESFLGAAFERFAETTDEAWGAAEIAETLLNGNISTAREAIVLNRTPSEAVVFALDVAYALSDRLDHHSDGENLEAAIVRVRRCVAR